MSKINIRAMMRAIASGKTTTTEIGSRVCPTCHYAFDMASGEEGSSPRPGDASFCIGCGAILRYTEKLGIELFPRKELRRLPEGEYREMLRVQALIRACHAQRPN